MRLIQKKCTSEQLLKSVVIAISLLSTSVTATAQVAKTKLIVGIVVDQMRYDYLSRYRSKFSENGFNRLMQNGYNCIDTHINYIPTYTAPGHASIYTGAVPAIHGIIGNDWYDKQTLHITYCVEDSSVTTIGSDSRAGQMSPHNLQVTTIGDEMRLNSHFESKVIGIALKDRSSVLPGGHLGNAAYFFDYKNKVWITSSYYEARLPDWVADFNNGIKQQFLENTTWETLLPITQYTESDLDNMSYEGKLKSEYAPVFPHKYLATDTISAITSSPIGNKLVLEFAKSTIVNEKLGSGKYTDLLAVSLSSTDYIGHMYGPRSIEVEDCYLRLDLELASFIMFLDKKLGKDAYTLFLTADHGVADNVSFSQQYRIPAGLVSLQGSMKDLEISLKKQYGDFNWIKSFLAPMLFLNDTTIKHTKINRQVIKESINEYLSKIPGVYKVVDLANLDKEIIDEKLKTMIKNGAVSKLTGDLIVILKSGWFEGYGMSGSTHGAWYNYDTHIPLIWYGNRISPGIDVSQVDITDISPTIAAMLQIQEPSGSVGKIIPGIFKPNPK